jgi:threonine synthase
MQTSAGSASAGVIARYGERLGIPSGARVVTLHEGQTPLIEAARLATVIGHDGPLFLKYEGLNPTGSFKDRGMTTAMTVAAFRGSEAVICASTGNTAASAAAYAARAGIACYVVIPRGKIAVGKLGQAVVHGAKVVEIDGNFDDALRIVRTLGNEGPCTIVNSTNPDRIQGQKTAAFEVCDELGRAPDFHCLPVGNAGNITACWMGYREYKSDEIVGKAPRMFGFQAAGAAPLVLGHRIDDPQTVATAIRIGDPASRNGAIEARDASGGRIDSVTDDEIISAYQQVASLEGVFAEPASAASVAGLKKAVGEKRIAAGSLVVCTLTGHGLKDPAAAMEAAQPTIQTRADVNEVREVLWA